MLNREISNIKALKDAWEFMKSNWALSLGAISILVILGFMKYIPVVGFAFAIAYSILSLSIQIYVGKAVYEDDTPNSMSKLAQNTTLSELFTKHLDIASGGFLGFFTLMLLFFFVFAMIISSSIDPASMQTIMQNGINPKSEAVITQILTNNSTLQLNLAIYLFVILTLSYALPAVMGRVILSDSFNSALKRVFLLFSPTLWKSILNGKYFILIFVWSMIIFFVSIVVSQLFTIIFLVPVAFVILYLISLYNAIIYIYSVIASQK